MKKQNAQRIITLLLMPVIVLTMNACKSKNKGVEETAVIPVEDGVIVVDTVSIDAMVTSKDEAKRKITLKDDMGGKCTYKVSPDMANFDQIQVGTMVSAVVTEEVGIYLGEALPAEVSAGGVMVAPGDAAAGMLVDVNQFSAVVSEVNIKHHKVTFTLPDGSTKKVKVDKKIDLSLVQVGDAITVQTGEGLALEVLVP